MRSNFCGVKVRSGAPKIAKLRKIEVLLGNAGPDDSRLALIVESARLRSGSANSHAISSIETRERVIFRFRDGPMFHGGPSSHMQLPSLRVHPRGNHG